MERLPGATTTNNNDRVNLDPPSLSKQGVQPRWKDDLLADIKQDGLIEYELSRAGIEDSTRAEPPSAVFLGLGLCTSKEISQALPFDALGMILPAERVRRSIGARSVIAMIADVHAASNSAFSVEAIEQIAAANEDTLRRIVSALGLSSVKVVRASDFHGTLEYQAVLKEVERRAPESPHTYFKKEIADIEFLNRVCNGIVKVGWTVSGSLDVERRHDEVAFDQRFRAWMGDHVSFMYCKAGRPLDERRPKASPYVTTDTSRRLSLLPGEDVHDKLKHAEAHASAQVVKGVRNHLGAIVRCFSAVVNSLSGTVEDRAQRIIDRIFGGGENVVH